MAEEGKEGAPEYTIENMMRSENGVLTIGPSRAVVTTEAGYIFLMKVLHDHAPHAIKYAFYDMGYRTGQELMQGVADRARDPEGSFRYLVETYRQGGYGDVAVVKFDISAPEARLSGDNLFEAGVATKTGLYRTPRCVDHYSRGIFAGFLSSLLAREVVCEEIACQYRGDERCEFVVLPFDGR